MRKSYNETTDELKLEPVGDKMDTSPFNGSKFIIIPIEIAEAHHKRMITTSEYELLRFIISRYNRKKIIPPIFNNDFIAKQLNLKKNSIEIMLSRLKKKYFIEPIREEKVRYLKVPLYEEILTEFNNRK